MSKILRYRSNSASRLPSGRRSREAASHKALRAADLLELVQAADLEELMLAFVRIATSLIANGRPFAVVRTGEAGNMSTTIFPTPDPESPPDRFDWPPAAPQAAIRNLSTGQHVVIAGPASGRKSQSENAKPSESMLLIPIVREPDAVLCVCLHSGVPPPHELEGLRLLCRLTAPLILRLGEVQRLKSESARYQRIQKETEELESRLREADRARKDIESIEHQMKSHLLSNMSHELRTPLVAIRGYTKMILEGRAGDLNGTQREYLTIVAENVNRLVALTGNLSRLTARQQLTPESFDICALLRECVSLIRMGAAEKKIALSCGIPTTSFSMIGDREKLGQVLYSLLLNAVKYTDQGGEIGVEFRSGSGGEATINVSDTGAGIPPELLRKLFDSCAQGRQHVTAPNGITVGLSMVHDIVYLHGGRISVTSRTGQGSTFSITLPVLKAGDEPDEV
jgi:signal transduction histidine kinase